MKKILIFAGRYLPGYKDGGPVRTLINLTDLLGDEYDMRLAVLDRDHGDREAYANILYNQWNQVGKARVWYYSPGQMQFMFIRKIAHEVDLVYLCGFYNDYGYKTLILNRLNLLWKKPVVVAPMGSFTEGALSQKTLKKRIFISLCKITGLFSNISWSVSSEMEAADLKRVIDKKAKYTIAEDPPRSEILGHRGKMSEAGSIRIAFIARICQHKNLLYLIEQLNHIKATVELSIGGSLQDEEYWSKCQHRLKQLPENISWNYCGEIPSEEIPIFLSDQDALALPTLGENYCHVVFEAMSVGCIPIISDQTPWSWIQEAGCGFVLPLDKTRKFAEKIDEIAAMDAGQKGLISTKAISAAETKVKQALEHSGYRDIFAEAK